MIMEETKVIYHIDDEETPYLIKLPITADRVTLGDLKNALNRPSYKFFFKSMDVDFGVVKEELIDDSANLPCFNGRVIAWLVTAESSSHSSDATQAPSGEVRPPGEAAKERVGGIGNSRPPSFHAASSNADQESVCTDTESLISSRRMGGHTRHERPRHHGHGFDAASSVMTSDIESVSVLDSEDTRSRFSSATGTTSRSSLYGRNRRKKFRHRMPPISQASSFTSITDSTMSLNIITVTLNMDTVNFLGISIVGQTNKGGDGGIYVGSIMKGGAVAQDGRIEPGDMILEVNGISFEDMSNDEAVQTLRSAAQRPGPVTLVVAKCWDPNPKGYLVAPRQEPVRPIDPSAWVAHTEAVRAIYGRLGPPPSVAGALPTGPGSVMTSIPESSLELHTNYSSLTSMPTLSSCKGFDHMPLTVNTDPVSIVRAMGQPDSGLEIRDRMWLKITIPNAFIGSDLVNWLQSHVEGFADRRDARKYACSLLKAGLIRHTVNKLSFSEQCYYTVADVCGDIASLNLDDVDSISDMEPMEMRVYDTLGPPSMPASAWVNQYTTKAPFPSSYMNPNSTGLNYVPPAPYNFVNDAMSLDSLLIANGADTVRSSSESTESGHSVIRPKTNNPPGTDPGSAAKVLSPSRGPLSPPPTVPDRMMLPQSLPKESNQTEAEPEPVPPAQ